MKPFSKCYFYFLLYDFYSSSRSSLNRSADDGTEINDQGAVGPDGNKTNDTGTRNRYVKAAVTLGALVVAVNIMRLAFHLIC